jgi:hypothetical protein
MVSVDCNKSGKSCNTATKHAKAKKRPGRPCASGGAGNIDKKVATKHGDDKKRYGRPCAGSEGKKKAPAKKNKCVTGNCGQKSEKRKEVPAKKKESKKVDSRIANVVQTAASGNVVQVAGSVRKSAPVQRNPKQGVSKPKQYANSINSAALH